jgi:hypothetical protein
MATRAGAAVRARTPAFMPPRPHRAGPCPRLDSVRASPRSCSSTVRCCATATMTGAGYIAAFLKPWPGGIAFYRSPTSSGFTLDTVLAAPAGMGTLAFDFWSGPTWRWDRGNELWVDLFSGTLSSADEIAVLGGANAIAVENADGEWESRPVRHRRADLGRALQADQSAARPARLGACDGRSGRSRRPGAGAHHRARDSPASVRRRSGCRSPGAPARRLATWPMQASSRRP